MATSLPPTGKNRRLRSRSNRPGRRSPHPISRHQVSATPTWGRRSIPRRLTAPNRFRLMLVWLVLLLSAIGLFINLFRLQVLDASKLREQAQQQQTVAIDSFVPRRQIVDRAGAVLAIDRPVFTLYAHPIMFQPGHQETIAVELAPILGITPAELLQKFASQDTGIRLFDNLSEDKAGQIKEMAEDGLELQQGRQRVYPYQELFANVLGYVDVDQQGQAGIEASHQDLLLRSQQTARLSRSGDGSILASDLPVGFLQQDDLRLQLTLDTRLQRVTRLLLQQQLNKFKAKRGTVLVMDVRDGSMLAMVSEPSYNPNRYFEADVSLFKNWAVTDLYEPGSTFKPINIAIAIENGAVTPDDVFFDEGSITVGGWPIQNFDFDQAGGRGSQTVTDIVVHSSNVGMVHIMRKLPSEVFYEWLKNLKLDERTGIDIPNEAAGQIKDREQFTSASVEPATTAFGQGFSLTPIKLLQLHAALANGGQLVTPHVIQGLFDSQDQLSWQPRLEPKRQIFSPQTTSQVVSIMERVVEDGTGEVAQIPGYKVAGKTGTAQKAGADGGYIDGAKITSFVSIFPADAPRYVVLTVVDEPQGSDAFGSTVAGPVSKLVMEAIINLEKMPPNEVLELAPGTPIEGITEANPDDETDSLPDEESSEEWSDPNHNPTESDDTELDSNGWN